MSTHSLISRRRALEVAGFGAAACAVTPFSRVLAAEEGASSALAEQAYVWAYPLVLSYTLFNASLSRGVAPNRFVVQAVLSTPAVNAAGPNVDTLYGSTWLDLTHEPQVIVVPDTHDRYYSIQLVDAYGNSFAYIGRRATGTKAGAYAITAPGWTGKLPQGVKQIAATTPHVFALTRTLVSGDSDLPGALAAQSKFAIAGLSGYPGNAVPSELSRVPFNFPVPDVAARGPAFFDDLGEALAVNPPLPRDQGVVKRFAALGVGPNLRPAQSGDKALVDVLAESVPVAAARIKKADYSTLVNGWRVNYHVANLVWDPLLRASINQFGPGTHIAQEALYFSARSGPDSKPLSGANRYAIRFPAGGLPPVDAFWSLTLYGPDFLLVKNPIKRYAIGDRTAGLARDTDGSLNISIQHDAPEDRANWLPAPAGPFQLILRTYQPRKALFDGSYHVPPLRLAQA
jgi:hypothetical protein